MQVIPKGDEIEIRMQGFEIIWGLKRLIRIKKNQIKSVSTTMPENTIWELRIPGSFFPGIIKAGTYFTKMGKAYWYVTMFKKHVITIELEGSKFKRIVIGFRKESEKVAAKNILS
ncbi:hypothetical protein IPM62_03800 [Candidatus Woesebacteria bacterium]|nr:MAG: hypothetical protein IPM62_03800 [Candidatus Woesebacteria bacterium]